MLSRTDFFSLVLPPEGFYCVVGLNKDKKPRQVFVETTEELSDLADALVHRGYDAYFALASFETDTDGRAAPNAKHLGAFFIDIDCGANKPYADQAEGMVALKEFVRASGLPKPTAVVNSGRGLHAYWVPEQAMPKDTWKPLAEGLKSLCNKHGLKADPSVTADAARILRVPETLNYKDPDSPAPTSILMAGSRVQMATLKELFVSEDSFEIAGSKPFIRQMDPTTLALMGNYESKFRHILEKSITGTGCAQLAYAYQNQTTLEEPLWRAALSIASRCSDASKAMHMLSKEHPGYSSRDTEYKASLTKGPYTCEWYRKEYPALCEGCTQKVTSPIQIGREVIAATEEDNVIVEEATEDKEEKTYVIPTYPHPFFRGRVGGVYRAANPDKEDDKDELIYPYDFYVVKRIKDPDEGECVWLRLHLPKDGVKDFMVPLNVVLSKEKFINAVSHHGVAVLGKKQDLLMAYVTRWVEELQAMNKAEIARKQLGWIEGDSGFILGDKEIRADGEVRYSPPTPSTLPLVPMMVPHGDLETWKSVVNTYGRPGMENRAFAFFMGFGGPLMKFVGNGMMDGFLLNMISPLSGSGKTTLLFAINSIYGRPKELLLSYKDTQNHRLQRLGAMQNITVTIDELTNMPPEMMSSLVYDISSGKGKNRLQSKANSERINHTTWTLPVVCSSNRSIKDALMSMKSKPDAELLRILELPVERDEFDDPTWSKQHFGQLMSNYGLAGPIYIEHLVKNLPEAKALLEEVNRKIDKAANIKNNERYWSAGAAIGITGGLISKNLGLHDIDVGPVFKFIVETIIQTRKRHHEDLHSMDDFLGLFIQQHFNEMLVVNGKLDRRTGIEMGPIREPKGKVVVRYEPDTKLLFVDRSVWRKECSNLYLGYEDTIKPYLANGSLSDDKKKKRMLAGTVAGNVGSVYALCFDTSKLAGFDEEALLNAENTGGEGSD